MENPEKIEIEGLKTIHKLCKFGADHNMEGCTFTEIVERMFGELAKSQAVPEGFVLVSQKDLLELTIAINAVDLATHTESKTNEVREMWQQVALKLIALGTTQEPK